MVDPTPQELESAKVVHRLKNGLVVMISNDERINPITQPTPADIAVALNIGAIKTLQKAAGYTQMTLKPPS